MSKEDVAVIVRRSRIECDSDILFHYLPAMPVVNVGE